MGPYSLPLETLVQVDLNQLFNTIIQGSANKSLWTKLDLPSVSVKKVLLEPLPLIHVCPPMAAFMLQWQSWVVATVTMGYKA